MKRRPYGRLLVFLERLNFRKSPSSIETPKSIKDDSFWREGWPKFFLQNGQSHYFYRPQEIMIHVKVFLREENDRLLVISPGRGESSLKYAELVQELSWEGLDIIVIDHRGQGFSSRIIDDPLIGHINKFENYTDDLTYVVENYKKAKNYSACILLGHSMGGLIGLRAILGNPRLFDGVILSGPMLKLKIKRIPDFISLIFLKMAILLGFGRWPLHHYFADREDSFEDNLLTNCQQRFDAHRYCEAIFPQTRLGIPSIKWLYEIVNNGRKVMRRAKELDVPILLMQAGKDQIVCPQHQDHFARKLPNGRVVRLKESRHEIFQEVDFIRSRAMMQVRKFLTEIQGKRVRDRRRVQAGSA